MTSEASRGMEELKKALIENGCTEQQANGKVVPYVVAILAENESLLRSFQLQEDITSLEKKLLATKCELIDATGRLSKAREQLNEEIIKYREFCEEHGDVSYYEGARKLVNESNKYLDRFFVAISNGETKEGNDALKKAQLFINTVSVESPQNNTAFIVGLASILSGKDITLMEDLKKVNNEKLEVSPVPKRFTRKAL